MAIEAEAAAQAWLENRDRTEKVEEFLSSGYSAVVADEALAAYWDHIQATNEADRIATDIRFAGYRGESRAAIRGLQAQQTEARTRAASHFRLAADYAAIAGAVQIARSDEATASRARRGDIDPFF